jgi:hypothetical protein
MGIGPIGRGFSVLRRRTTPTGPHHMTAARPEQFRGSECPFEDLPGRKHEIRNPKSETNPNIEIRNPKQRLPAFVAVWDLLLGASDLFRISDLRTDREVV